MTPLERITERVGRHGDVNDMATPRPLLTIPEFFDGNTAGGSIWCNCIPPPTPEQARNVLEGISARPEVVDVRVEVSMFDDPGGWPFSEAVYVVTSASPVQVKAWFPKRLTPGDVWVGWRDGFTFEPLAVPAGLQVVACWWD